MPSAASIKKFKDPMEKANLSTCDVLFAARLRTPNAILECVCFMYPRTLRPGDRREDQPKERRPMRVRRGRRIHPPLQGNHGFVAHPQRGTIQNELLRRGLGRDAVRER